MRVEPHRRAAQMRIGGLHRAGRQCGAVEVDRRVPHQHAMAASGAETPGAPAGCQATVSPPLASPRPRPCRGRSAAPSRCRSPIRRCRASPTSGEQHRRAGIQTGRAVPGDGGGEERHRPGAQRRKLPGVHGVPGDPGRAPRGCGIPGGSPAARRGGSPVPRRGRVAGITVSGNAEGAERRRRHRTGRRRTGPASVSNRLADTAKESAPAMPTPAACQDTARDCATPSSGSAIAFSPGM